MALTFLERFRPAAPSPSPPVFEGLAQVRAYWEALRSDGLPTRQSLDPRGLGGMLERVFLAERVGKGLAQLRIAGSGLVDLAGIDPRGLPLSCLFAPESRDVLSDTMERVFSAPAVAEVDLGADRGRQGTIIARLVLLPLRPERDGHQVLGAVGFHPGGVSRCRFQVLARREERLVLPPMPQPTVQPPEKRRGHLTLVHSSV